MTNDTKNQALSLIGGAIPAFREFAASIKRGVPRVRKGSQAEKDQLLSGNKVIPHLIVSGLVISAADHLSAWAELCDSPKEDGKALLHLAADYTLLRPVLEGFVETIWILSGETSNDRVKRAMEIAKIEYIHGTKLKTSLEKSSFDDPKTIAGIEFLGKVLRQSAISIEIDPDKFLADRPVDPSAITRKIASRVSGATMRTSRYWAITSAHAHGQLISMLRFADESPLQGPHQGGSYYAPDEKLLAEILTLIEELIGIAMTELNEQGYELSMT